MSEDEPFSRSVMKRLAVQSPDVLYEQVEAKVTELERQITDQAITNTKLTKEIDELKTERGRLREELDSWWTIHNLQRKREQPWLERWRLEAGKPNTLPDYGVMLGWLYDELDALRSVKEDAKHWCEIAGEQGTRRIALDHQLVAEREAHAKRVVGMFDLGTECDNLREALRDMVNQYAYDVDGKLSAGGLSTLELAFETLRLPNPCTRDDLWKGKKGGTGG